MVEWKRIYCEGNFPMKNFLSVLFDPEDQICTGNLYQIRVTPQHETLFGEFIAINALQSTRKDSNVVKYRNFLIEIDAGTLEDQLKYVDTLGLPFSTCVYSGGKSLHFIISLTEPLANEAEYRDWAADLLSIVDKADPTTHNPSRFTRMPGVVRPDKGKFQELIKINGRVTQDELAGWMLKFRNKLIPYKQEPLLIEETEEYVGFTRFTQDYLAGRITTNINNAVYCIAHELKRKNFSEEYAQDLLIGVSETLGMEVKKTCRTIKSAYERRSYDAKK
jgi:hypothetical protein